jgi:hypothetical protein
MEPGKYKHYVCTERNNSLPRKWSQGSIKTTSVLKGITPYPEHGAREV